MLVTRRCRLVQLRDGRPAAVWRGLAFPVLPGDRIDGAGEAWPIPETVSSSDVSKPFGVIDGQSEAYVLIAGGFIDVETAAGKLRTAGFEVLRTGRYLGDPIENLDADWFVRIVRPPVSVDLAESLEPILGQPALRAPPMIPGDRRARLLTAELLAARGREEELRAELIRLRTITDTASEATVQIEALQDALAEEQRHRDVT